MIRLETETGYWLVTHVDHAHLAGDIATKWGNDLFLAPEPRANVLRGIRSHDDGWAGRDQQPQITRQGKPSAFSVELVGKYSAFEEIDLVDYLAVRGRAVSMVAELDAYAALLVSMHTYNLLTARADRSTIRAEQLPMLDAFLSQQLELQRQLRATLAPEHIDDNFRLLQACDNMSLLSCVDSKQSGDLLHPLPLRAGGESRVVVERTGERHFQLTPYPFAAEPLIFSLPARHVEGKLFSSADDFAVKFQQAEPVLLQVTLT